jgi:hypothetical protein
MKVYFVLACYIVFLSQTSTVFSQSEQEKHNTDQVEGELNESGATLNLEDMLKMDQAEKDKILSCIEILSNKIKKDGRVIENTSQMLAGKVEADMVSQKITGDMHNKCYYSIDDATVQSIFSNGVFIDPEFDEEMLTFAEVDYSAYKLLNPNEFQLTPETQILFMKLEQARTEFIANTKAKNEKNKNEFHLFGYSLKSIPAKFSLLFGFLVVLAFIVGILYSLNIVMDNMKKTKAAKKKEKNQ